MKVYFEVKMCFLGSSLMNIARFLDDIDMVLQMRTITLFVRRICYGVDNTKCVCFKCFKFAFFAL